MIATLVHVYVKEESINDFIRVTIINHDESVKEPGNLRFDILQDASDPSRFVLYEAYESEEASIAHKNTSHYLIWRDSVADWMAQPRQGIRHTIVYPLDRTQW